MWNDSSSWGGFDPWRELDRFAVDAARVLGGLWSAPTRRNHPPTNVYASPEAVLLQAQVPGYGPHDFEVALEGRTLMLRGAVRADDGAQNVASEAGADTPISRSFARSFRMPYRVDAEGVRARLVDGVLDVRVPRAPEDRPKRIEIEG